MAFAAFVINTIGILATVTLPFAFSGEKPLTRQEATVVEIVLGTNSSQSRGNAPAISLFNNHGERTARYSDKSTIIAPGGSYQAIIKHGNEINDHTRWWPPRYAETASYILLSGIRDDAICISAVYVTEANFKAIFMGDIAWTCGAPWGYGDTLIGGGEGRTYNPKCFWLDGDGSDGSPKSVSIHLPDFIGTNSKLEQYANDKTTMCNSTPRFAWWPKLEPHAWIPTFQPPLEYLPDKDSEGNTGEPLGADKDLSRIVDKPGQFDRNVARYQPPDIKDPYVDSYDLTAEDRGYPDLGAWGKRGVEVKRGPLRRREPLTDHLVVSQHAEHSAKLLCESPTSRMQDFVSLTERLFCDMDTKTLYPLCDDEMEQKGIVVGCFKLKTHTLVLADGTETVQNVGDGSLVRRAEPKVYKSTKYW